MSFTAYRNHPNLPCKSIYADDTNCIGKEFGIENDGDWYNPIQKYHGTHVAGTIAALGNNDLGVHGVINDGEVCLVIARVFGESGAGSRMSNIYDAVEWMADQGVRVINMSLGGSEHSTTGQNVMKAARDAGVLLVAASGNNGSTDLQYPAGFDGVISVGAVGQQETRAIFSQYNSFLDIAGPGVDILSTFPLNLGGALFVSSPSGVAAGKFMEKLSQTPTEDIYGELVDCGYGESVCPGISGGGHICLIKR